MGLFPSSQNWKLQTIQEIMGENNNAIARARPENILNPNSSHSRAKERRNSGYAESRKARSVRRKKLARWRTLSKSVMVKVTKGRDARCQPRLNVSTFDEDCLLVICRHFSLPGRC